MSALVNSACAHPQKSGKKEDKKIVYQELEHKGGCGYTRECGARIST